MNINSDKDYIDSVDVSQANLFPFFLKRLELEPFRHIPSLDIQFKNPISVISGTNRSGKSTILMALACSHFEFIKRNPKNGKLERHTWSSLMKFTSHDIQEEDWTYFITYKKGKKEERKRGQRKNSTKKWNGIGKKETQFKFREVIFVDLDRIVPARFYGDTLYRKSKNAAIKNISERNVESIEYYMSHILEEKFKIQKIAQHLDKDVFKYDNSNQYSSYNAASGEDVLTRIIIDIVEAPKKSLILIDEIEMGLHPKVQRRLIDAIRNIARKEEKQFVLTTHSSTILDAVPPISRVFIQKTLSNQYRSIQDISVNAALTKMDANSFPLIDLYCEDKEAEFIINKAISEIEKQNAVEGFSDLINIIISGSASLTYENFKSHERTYNYKVVRSGYACILDGDMKDKRNNKGEVIYPPEEHLHFLYSNECPEKFLTKAYLSEHPNATIEYYLENENPHILPQIILDNSKMSDIREVFDYCWKIVVNSPKGSLYFKTIQKFLLNMAKKYSPEL